MATATKEAPAPVEVPTDDTLLVKAQNMNIHQYVPKNKAGQYDDQVETLLKVDKQTGYQNSIEILVPAGEVKKHKRWFNTSAANYDKGSRIVNGEQGETQGDGGVLLEFVLTKKRVLKKTADSGPSDDTPEAA